MSKENCRFIMKKSSFLATSAAFFALAALSVFAQTSTISSGSTQNMATVNGKAVPKARLDLMMEQAAKAGQAVTPDMVDKLREAIILRELCMQEADKLGLTGSDDIKAQVDLARQLIVIRELFADYQRKNTATDADVKAEYDKVAARDSGKEYKARHILVGTEADAKAIIVALKGGGDFEDIARKQSKDPGSVTQGGDLGWARLSKYIPEFSQALLKLGMGQMSEAPLKTQFGYHVLRLDDIRSAPLPPFEQAKPQIAQQIQQRKLMAFQEDLRKKARVE
jgi:peptidyl-prolyl cis-trans isomerase C